MDNSNAYKELLLSYQWQIIENNQIFNIAKDNPLLWIELRKRLHLLPQYTRHMFAMMDDSLRQNLHGYNYMLLSLIALDKLQPKDFERSKRCADMVLSSIKGQFDLFNTFLAKKPHIFFVLSFALGYIKNRFFSKQHSKKNTDKKN